MDIQVYIFGDQVAFRTSASDRVFWAPDCGNTTPTAYTGPIPNTGRRVKDPTVADVNCCMFQFTQTKLDGETMALKGYLRTLHLRGKSNTLGFELSGPFSWMARMLKLAGAKNEYDVHSPKVLFKWTAKDLVKYCDRLANAS